ncbi:MAG: ribonuclease R family protein [Myxococcota bacterium]
MRVFRPSAAGQRVEVEDGNGETWRVDCLGEPVPVGTRILFEPLTGAEARQGVLVRWVEAERESWVCTLRRGSWGRSLAPFSGLSLPRLSLAERDAKDAKDGDRVLVAPIQKRNDKKKGRGRRTDERAPEQPVRVIAVLGPVGNPDADFKAIAWKHRLPREFTRRARVEAEEFEAELSAKELGRRLDLRHLPFITIDPSSARDHDDALFAEMRRAPALSVVKPGSGEDNSETAEEESTPRGWDRRVWVAIADVAHYVEAGGWVDSEARRRGNSFYFPDRSVPMLPERLSSDLCSLRPDCDRLAMVAELRIGEGGAVVDALFHEAVIRSHARLSYEEAAEWLARDSSESTAGDGPSPGWLASLRCLAEAAERWQALRRKEGAVSLELPETEIVLGENGAPVDARLRARNSAHGLVEEAMLAANRAVAQALDRAERRTIHRVHPPPSPRKLEALSQLLEGLGIGDALDLTEPGELARMLERVQGTPAEERIHIATLRSMSQARYEPESKGHFALQFKHYLHFTSPIRRYADLDVHRALKRMLRDQPEPVLAAPSGAETEAEGGLAGLGIWLSGRERVAMEAEREADALACCALMQGREGERFEAKVTGTTDFGLFIRLDAPAVSGLIPMRALEGYWNHDPGTDSIVGGRSGRRISLGDRLAVRLGEVDSERSRLGFRLAGSGMIRTEPEQAALTQVRPASSSESDSHSS